MKTVVVLASLLLALTACGGADRASDPAGGTPGSTALPDEVPAAPDQVRSRALATVMDTGTGAELCLGPVAESWPPQCGGPSITNWDWDAQRGMFERQGDVRWGTFAVTGTWDGTAFTVTGAVPGALYDPAPVPPVELPDPSTTLAGDELEAVAREVGSTLPGAQGAYPDSDGHVLVDVIYDDGTLQDAVDDIYGVGVVVVTPALTAV